jgi:hypothetical protein
MINRIEPNGLVRIHPAYELKKLIERTYDGHHFVYWKNPKEIWYKSTKSIFFDFGEDELFLFKKYDERSVELPMYCIQRIQKKDLIIKNGGEYF